TGGPASASGDGGLRALSVVRAVAGGGGHRVGGWGCGEGASVGGAQAEDGPSGRRAPDASADRRPVSQDLGAEPGSTRCAAVAGASAQAGATADADQEPAAGHGV